MLRGALGGSGEGNRGGGEKAGGQAIAVVCDAAIEDDVRRLVAAGLKAFGRIDTLVNNAGEAAPTKPVQDYRWRTGATRSIRA